MNITPNFTMEEMTRSQTATRNGIDNTPKGQHLDNLARTCWFLETLRSLLREYYMKPLYVVVSSGYRCPELNLIIGGSKTSAHMKGLAADISVPGLTPYELAKFIEKHMDDYDQVIHEFGRWVHVGLADVPREQSLTAMKEDGKTVYKQGILEL